MTQTSEPSVDDIRAALMGRYPVDQFVHVHEAPMTADRQGRKLDVLVVGVWKSRGYARIGIEIKRSIGDFRTELAEPDKADWWVQHCHEFWIAAPSAVARRIELDGRIPHEWGLLAVSDKGVCRSIKAAPIRKHPEDLPWGTLIGCLRSASGVGTIALQRRFEEGVSIGRRQAEVAYAARDRLNDQINELDKRDGRTYYVDAALAELNYAAETLDRAAARIRDKAQICRDAYTGQPGTDGLQ